MEVLSDFRLSDETSTASKESPMKALLEVVLNAVMRAERSQALKAEYYERSEERVGYANGFKDKTLNSRMGQLNLKIPQTRDVVFYPQCLERGLRSERALKLAVAEMYIKGISTRKVQAITRELCGTDFSSEQVSRLSKELDEEFSLFRNRPLETAFPFVSLDATYLKIRHGGSVISQAVLIAYGVNESGQREVLGVMSKLSEAEIHWREFLQSLQARGLRGIRMITSDDHAGLKAALRSVFPSVPWQRCQFHMSQNAQSKAPKQAMRGEIAQAMKRIFASIDQREADERMQQAVEKFSKTAPAFTEWLEDNIREGLTCLSFPEKIRKRVRTSNGIERINKEIKRRSRVATLFPNTESAVRLVTGVLVEIHEAWVAEDKRYLDLSEL
jgi:transposase-like protein